MKEKINISNYKQIWNHYLNGSLSEMEEEMLFAFLDKNPDLYGNLEEDVETILDAPDVVLENKEKLFAENQTDFLLIAKTENVISEEEDKIISKKISTDANIKRDYELYKRTKINADLSATYPNKNSLKKSITIPLYRRVAAVAAIITFAYVAGNFVFESQDNDVFIKTAGITQFDNISKPVISPVENTQTEDVICQTIEAHTTFTETYQRKTEQLSEGGYEIAGLERMPVKQATALNLNFTPGYEIPVLRTNNLVASAASQDTHIKTYEIEHIKSEQDNRLLSSVNKVFEAGREFNINESIRNLRDKRNELIISANN